MQYVEDMGCDAEINPPGLAFDRISPFDDPSSPFHEPSGPVYDQSRVSDYSYDPFQGEKYLDYENGVTDDQLRMILVRETSQLLWKKWNSVVEDEAGRLVSEMVFNWHNYFRNCMR